MTEILGFEVTVTPEFVALIIAVIALAFNCKSFDNDRKSRNIQTLLSIFERLPALDDEYNSTKRNKKTRGIDIKFFNTLELFAHLVNHKLIDRECSLFFEDAFVSWYKTIFLKHAKREEIDDPAQYEEMKKLYRKLTTKKTQ